MSSTVVPNSSLETSVPGLWKQPPTLALTYLPCVESDLRSSCKFLKCCLITWRYVDAVLVPSSFLLVYICGVYVDTCGYVDVASALLSCRMVLCLSEIRQLPCVKLSSTLLRGKKQWTGLNRKWALHLSTIQVCQRLHILQNLLVIKAMQMLIILQKQTKHGGQG